MYNIFISIRSEMWILVQLITLTPLIAPSVCKVFTMGYLTGSQRLPDDKEYQRHGLTISGAISLAVEEVNAGELGRRGHKLEFIIAETYGKEKISVAQTAELWRKNVSVYIGPQEYCEHEAYMAASFNLPMISYVSMWLYSYYMHFQRKYLISNNFYFNKYVYYAKDLFNTK